MKLCRFRHQSHEIRIGLWRDDQTLTDLSAGGISTLTQVLEASEPGQAVEAALQSSLPTVSQAEVELLSPVETQEVWAAGVTYLRSKKARMDESNFSATAYDKVYDAPRPEIFFKSLPSKVVGPGEPVGIRKDATWNVPEPELALVINSQGVIVGYTIGNDMSSRDIEGENLLYLPQAKVYDRSCAVGPWIEISADEGTAREWTIQLSIERGGHPVFTGSTSVNQIKRSFPELAGYLCRSQTFPNGALLLTGTGVVPGDDFTLQPDDSISIEISGIGVLRNPVTEV